MVCIFEGDYYELKQILKFIKFSYSSLPNICSRASFVLDLCTGASKSTTFKTTLLVHPLYKKITYR